jgi:phosphate transport system permease protein
VNGRNGTRGDRLLQAAGLGVLALALGTLGTLLWQVGAAGIGRIDVAFLTGFASYLPERAGIWPALAGTLWLLALTALLALPIGMAAAVHLEEYGGRGRLARLAEINITNLAGVPSIVYGLLGLGLFVRGLGMDRSVLAGASTLALLVLPVVILSTREALRAVPSALRESSLALGATRWQTIRHQVLPQALPGALTGIILALSRAIGETAPLIVLGALTFVPFAPNGPWSPFTALPIQIFNWISRPQPGFRLNAAGAIVVLIAVLVTMNGVAVWLRDRARQRRVE